MQSTTRTSLWGAAAFVATMAVSSVASAGEVKFGKEPLETDDAGKLTAEARAATVTEVPSLPGEEVWPIYLWADLDRGAPGPLYVEFIGTLNGKPYLTHRYEYPEEYGGEESVTMDFEVEGNTGFNRGKTYVVKVTQASAKGKDIELAKGKVTLVYTEAPEEPEEEDEDEEDGEGVEEPSAQDEIDTLAPEVEPPPVASSKKGCSLGAPGLGFPAVLLLFGLLMAPLRRRA